MRNYKEKLFDSSRAVADMLIEDIGGNPDRFKEMFDLCLLDKYPLSMRAARALALSAEVHPELVLPHKSEILNKLENLKTEGVRRGLLKLFIDLELKLTEDELGLLTDLAFRWLASPKQAVAIRYYSLEILLRVTRIYPELAYELIEILNDFKEESAGLQAASYKALKELHKIKQR